MLVGGEPGPWGPSMGGGKRWRVLRRVSFTLGVFLLVSATAVATTGMLLVQQAESSLTRVPVQQLDEATEASGARHFLLVGSDSRDGLAPGQRGELSLGSFDGQRSDTIIYVAISADRSTVSLVSLPRDLLVDDDGRRRKLTDTFAGGPDRLIRVIRDNFGLPVNHYAQISLAGFVNAVRTLGGVELCLDAPLRDRKSGADFDAGCHHMEAEEALAYVRSRSGPRADFERIDRQQQFLRAVLGELVDTRVLANVPRLFRLVDDLAGNVTTDEELSIGQMRSLAQEMAPVIRDGMPMATLPSYARTIDGISFVVPYGPGARAMLENLLAGRPLPDPGTREQRADINVAVWTGSRPSHALIVRDTLLYGGFLAGTAGPGPAELDAGPITTIYRLPDDDGAADRVAATLGAAVEPLPEDVSSPQGADVVVAVGDDATDQVGVNRR